MCCGIVCSACVNEKFMKELGENEASIVKMWYDHWRESCPNEDALALGTMIPMYLSLLDPRQQYYFLYTIALNFDPLTLSEWGL